MRGQRLIEERQKYERLRRVCWIAFLSLTAFMILALLFLFLASKGPKRGSEFVTRLTTDIFVSQGREIPVEIYVSPAGVPEASPAPEDGRRLDILIGLDNSLSMVVGGSTALERIKEVAIRLLENTDLDRHQIGIVRMDEEAQVVQTLSRNLPVLRRLVEDLPEGGSTRVDEGLQAMRREFASIRRQPGSLGLAILLTDGRTNAAAARQEAGRLTQQEGVFLAPIGIGDAIDADLLRALSSFPSEYRQGSETDALTAIYRDWVAIMERLVAVDVRIEEFPNTEGLSLVSGSSQPPATAGADKLEWSFPFLTTEPLSLLYRLRAERPGWRSIDGAQGRVSLHPVGAEPTVVAIHRKPKVIIGTPLLWLLLPLLLLLLLPWLLAWWRRRRALLGPALLPPEIDPPDLFPTPEPLPGLDLARLVRPTAPTLVIGLGGTGRWTLTYLKKAVLEASYGRLPDSARFLLFDTQEAEIQGASASVVRVGGVELADAECIFLHEDTASPEQLLERTRGMVDRRDADPHLRDWWPAEQFQSLTVEQTQISRGTNQRRPFGRMALFLDLEGGPEESRFWQSVGSAVREVAQHGDPTIFIAASTSGGTGSGMLVDAAYLVRRICRDEGVKNVTINALVALQNTFAARADSLGLTRPNAFAALRELDRFLACRDRRFPMIYSEDRSNAANGRLDAPLLDNCYVFDAEREVNPLTREAPERGVFPAMADSIYTFLYAAPGSGFSQELKQHKAAAEFEREESGHGVVSSLGTYVFRLPMYEFLESFKYRFAGELVADLLGAFQAAEVRWALPSLSAEEQADLDGRLDDFLSREGEERTPVDVLQVVAMNDLEMLVAVLEADRAIKAGEEYVERHRRNLNRHLAGYWMAILNAGASGEEEPIAAAKRFSAALYLAGRLKTRVGTLLAQARDRSGALFGGAEWEMIEAILTACHEAAAAVEGRLESYRDGLLGADGEGLLNRVEATRRAQVESRQLESNALVREYLYSEALEAKLYDDYLGQEVRKNSLRRFVWHCRERDGRTEVALKLVTAEVREIAPGNERTMENAGAVTELAELILQPMWDLEITPYLKERYPVPASLADRVHERASPLIQFDREKAPWHTRKLFTNLSESEYAGQLLEQLYPKFSRREHVKQTAFRDSHGFSTVTVADSLPLPALLPYQQALAAYLSVPERHRVQLHVFPAEQRAAHWEQLLQTIKEERRCFHPRFTSYLAEPERVELFARCVLYDLIPEALSPQSTAYRLEVRGDGGEGRYSLRRGREGGDRPYLVEPFEVFVSGEADGGVAIPFDRLREGVARKREELEDRRAYLERRGEELEALRSALERRSGGTPARGRLQEGERDMLSYIALILREEIEEVEARP